MDYELNEGFKIDNDNAADWAIKKIREEEEERDRLIAIAAAQIEALNSRIEDLNKYCESKTGYLRSLLIEYFNTVPHKETKTQETYKLLSGSLVFKKPSVKIVHDDERLLEYLKANAGIEFIKVKESIDWASFKSELVITDDGKVVDTGLGIVVDGCTVEEVPASFSVKY